MIFNRCVLFLIFSIVDHVFGWNNNYVYKYANTNNYNTNNMNYNTNSNNMIYNTNTNTNKYLTTNYNYNYNENNNDNNINNNNNNNNLLNANLNFYNEIPRAKPTFSYVGCYNDRRESRDISEKDFSYITKYNKSIPTVELCVQLCANDYYTIAGIQAL